MDTMIEQIRVARNGHMIESIRVAPTNPEDRHHHSPNPNGFADSSRGLIPPDARAPDPPHPEGVPDIRVWIWRTGTRVVLAIASTGNRFFDVRDRLVSQYAPRFWHRLRGANEILIGVPEVSAHAATSGNYLATHSGCMKRTHPPNPI